MRRIFLTLLVLFPAVWFSYGSFWNTTWYQKWFLQLALIFVGLGFWLGKRIHWSVVPAFIVTTLSGFYTTSWFGNTYSHYPLLDYYYLSKLANYTLLSFVVLWVGVSLLRNRDRAFLERVFAWACFADSVLVIWQKSGGKHPYQLGGFFGNESMNASFIALTYPFLAFSPRVLLHPPLRLLVVVILPLVAVVLSGSSMAVLTLAAVVSTHLFLIHRGEISLKRRIIIAGVSAALVLGGLLLKIGAHAALDPSGRYEVWKLGMEYWQTGSLKDTFMGPANPWLGFGLGTTAVLLPYAQEQVGRSVLGGYMWFHNEVLQVLFELGWLGLLSYGVLAFAAFRRALSRPYLSSALVGYGVCCLANYPIHMASHAFLGVFLIMQSFKGDSSCTKNSFN